MLILLALLVVILLCFAAGLLARRSFGKKISKGFEKNLMLLFPRYAIFKEQMAGSIGSGEHKTKMKPVLIKFDDLSRLGFEIDRSHDNMVTVFLPGAPDPWSGQVIFVEPKQVEETDIEFGDAMAMFERLGRHSAAMMETTVTTLEDGGA